MNGKDGCPGGGTYRAPINHSPTDVTLENDAMKQNFGLQNQDPDSACTQLS